MKKFQILFIGLIGLSCIISSCSNEKTATRDLLEVNPEDLVLEDFEMDIIEDLLSLQIEAATANEIEAVFPSAAQLKSSANPVSYPVKTVEYPAAPAKWPRIITIDYGPENITVNIRKKEDAELRGKVIIKKTGPYYKEGSTRTVSFQKFYFNNMGIVGSKVYINMGLNNNGNFVFKRVVDLKASNDTHFWKKRKVRKERELVEGAETKEWNDNAYSVTGDANGSNSEKWEWNRTIIEPLYRYASFRYPVSGIVEVVNTNTTFRIDYGDGEKDTKAILIFDDGTTKEISLDKNK